MHQNISRFHSYPNERVDPFPSSELGIKQINFIFNKPMFMFILLYEVSFSQTLLNSIITYVMSSTRRVLNFSWIVVLRNFTILATI